MRRLFILSFVLLLCCSSLIVAQQVPAELVEKAIEFAKNQDETPEETIQQMLSGNIHTLYTVAKSMNQDDPLTSIQIWHALADSDEEGEGHVLSQVALGFTYSEEDKPKAIYYFIQAGENGPHQAALYNAGNLLLEVDDYVKSLAYFKAAATLHETHPMHTKAQLSATSRQAYEMLSQQLMSSKDLPVQVVVNMFLYANLSGFPHPNSDEENLWDEAITALEKIKTADASNGHRKKILENLGKLKGNPKLSPLQIHLINGLITNLRAHHLDKDADEL